MYAPGYTFHLRFDIIFYNAIGFIIAIRQGRAMQMIYFYFKNCYVCINRTDERTGWIRIADRPAMDVPDCQNGATRFRFYR